MPGDRKQRLKRTCSSLIITIPGEIITLGHVCKAVSSLFTRLVIPNDVLLKMQRRAGR